jgi:hypothetical protein
MIYGGYKIIPKESIYEDMSEPERIVSEFLRYELNIWWHYEFPIFVYDEKERPRVWSPDFFLPNLGMYIEVVGSKKNWEDNRKNYQYRQKIYKNNKVNIIFIHFWREDWKSHTVQMIQRIENARHAKVQKLNLSHS